MKGISITHIQAFLRQRIGPDAWSKLLDRLPEHDKMTLSVVVAEAWYENSIHIRINRAFCDLFYGGDLAAAEELGRFSADRDFSVFHRWVLRLTRPSFVLQHINTYWRYVQDTGRWETETHRNTITAKLFDWDMCDAVMCRRFLGYIGRALELYGKVPQKAHRLCRARGDALCLFSFEWQLTHDAPIGWNQPSLADIPDVLNELRVLPTPDSLSAAIISIVHDNLSFPWAELWSRPVDSDNLTLARSAGTRTGAPLARIDLQHVGRDVGRLNVEAGPTSRQDVLETLVPWFSLLLDAISQPVEHQATKRHLEDRLQAARAEWSLTPKETAVLRLVVQGEPNKAIAKILKCEERTVEQHMTKLLKKTSAKTRSMLFWIFWKKK
ncbi:LuxR C-terminal-related transcriptional regulator [Sorangium sp. So ce136]|uniref:LuxR C-terminal-related transcriptional regulator n=1 Tax=Sorangium sp. So ce136 TaxID=3133284 RepID=UPI003EFF542E